MKRAKRLIRKIWPWALLICMVLITLYMDIFCANSVLDGDMSEYMVRANEIHTQGRLIPQGYAFTSEMRLLDMPLLFSLFFNLTADWTLVRVLGTVAAQTLMVLAFLYMLRSAGVKREARLIGAALLLMPFSAAYARIMLYHAHYTLYMAECCVMLGLTLKLCEAGGKKPAKIIRAALLGLMWFACGLNGVKHLMLLGLPLGLCAVNLLCGDLRKPDAKLRPMPDSLRLLIWLIFCLICFVPGYLINVKLITPSLSVQAQEVTAFGGSIQESRLLTLCNNLLHAMGVRVSGKSLIGLRGVSLGCALLLFGCAWWLSASRKRDLQNTPESIQSRVLTRLPLTALLGTAALLLLVDGHEPEEWYFIVPLGYILPMLCIEWQDGFVNRTAPLLRRVLCAVCALCLCFQGAYSVLFMKSMGKNRMDTWTGLPLHVMNVTEELQPIADYLTENGETRCLAPYWYASPLTEMTDGAVRAGAYFYHEDGLLGLHNYGSCLWPYQGESLPESVPILLSPEDAERLQRDCPSSEYLFSCGSFEMWRLQTAEAQLDQLLK